MPVAAECPNCGGPLDKTSFLADVPQCTRCGTLVTEHGGTLGMTSAYGVNDPNLTRSRVESDLKSIEEAESRYRGTILSYQAQLGWKAERYARIPDPPQLLQTKEAPSFVGSVVSGALVWFWFWYLIVALIFSVLSPFLVAAKILSPHMWNDPGAIVGPMVLLSLVLGIGSRLIKYFTAAGANLKIQAENARRRKEYEKAKVEAMKAALPEKERTDHDLRRDIVKLEGFLKAATHQKEYARELLKKL